MRRLLFAYLLWFGATQLCCHAGANGSDINVELRGIFEVGATQSFSVYHSDSKRSSWIDINQQRHGLTALAYDSSSKALTVDYWGELHTLKLRVPDMIPIPVFTNLGASVESAAETGAQETGEGYHDQDNNPAAALMVLKAVRKRQKQQLDLANHSESVREIYYNSNGSRIIGEISGTTADKSSLTDSIIGDPEAYIGQPSVKRNRVYNVDYNVVVR